MSFAVEAASPGVTSRPATMTYLPRTYHRAALAPHNGHMVSARKQLKIAKQTRNAARLAAMAAVVGVRDQGKQPRASAPTPPGWYPDPYDRRFLTYFNGQQWIPESRRLPGQIAR